MNRTGIGPALLLGLLTLAAAILVTTLFFPGFMSYDSLHQYRQIIGEIPIANEYPPIMVYLWRAAYRLIPSPGSMLLVHQVAYWGAAVLFAVAAV